MTLEKRAVMNAVAPYNLPIIYEDILAAATMILDQPVLLAGGALRDHVLGAHAKDIDLFIAVKSHREWEAALDKLLDDFGDFEYDGDFESTYRVWTHECIGYATFRWPADDPEARVVQVIGIDLGDKPFTMENLVETFDFGICKLAWDGKTTYVHGDALLDFYDGSLTLCKAANLMQLARSMERCLRWGSRSFLGDRFVEIKPEVGDLIAAEAFNAGASNEDDLDPFGVWSETDD